MLEATLQKTRGVLQKSYKDLPISKDLPRLASRIRVEDADGRSLLPVTKEGATPLDHLFNLLRTLFQLIEGEEEAQKMEKAFATHFENAAVVERIMENKLESFIAQHLGGDAGRVIRLLKSCNQSAIAGAIIELKVTLGQQNVTKDVANSWYFVITFAEDTITIRNRKREQSVDGTFTFEWILSFVYDRKITGCKDISLKVMDLAINPNATAEKSEEVRRLLDKYLDKTVVLKSPRERVSNLGELSSGGGAGIPHGQSANGVLSDDPISIDLLPGEVISFRDKSATHVHILGNAAGTVYVTNYRVVFDTDNKRAPALDGIARYRSSLLITAACTELPLTYIVNIKKKSQRVDLYCKDMRIVRFQFPSGMKSITMLYDAIQKALPEKLANTFAFAYAAKLSASMLISPRDVADTWDKVFAKKSGSSINEPSPTDANFDPNIEFKRLKLSADRWRLSTANVDYTLCASLAATLVVPKNVSDAELLAIAEGHTRRRLPIFSWRSPMNAVLLRGGAFLQSKTSESAEKLLRELVESNPNRSLFVLEVSNHDHKPKQPRLPDALQAAVKFEQLDLPTISLLQSSFQRLAKALHQSTRANDSSDWLVAVNDSKWLHQLQELLSQALKVVDHLERGRAVMLVDSADISDRIPQLSSLAQVMMDPHYRTVAGFGSLIEKEWIAYGHPFQMRCGHLSRAVPSPSDHAPVFLQWVDCVYQLIDQFPSAFEFTSSLLLEMMHQVYACMFGNFLANTEQERKALTKHVASVWQRVVSMPEYRNISYALKARVLIPSTNFKRIRLWTEYFCKSDPDMQGVQSLEHRQGTPSVGYEPTDLQKAQEANDDLQAENRKLLRRIESLENASRGLRPSAPTGGQRQQSPNNSVSKSTGEAIIVIQKTNSGSSLLGSSPTKRPSPLSLRQDLSPPTDGLGQSNSATQLHHLYNQSGSTNPVALSAANNNARRLGLGPGEGSTSPRRSHAGHATSGKGVLVRTGSSPDMAKALPGSLQPREVKDLSHSTGGGGGGAGSSSGDRDPMNSSGNSTPPPNYADSPRQPNSHDSPTKGNSRKDKKGEKKEKKEKKHTNKDSSSSVPTTDSEPPLSVPEPSPRGHHSAAPRVPRPRDVGSNPTSTDPSPAGSIVMASRATMASATPSSVAGRPATSEITKGRATEDPAAISSSSVSSTTTVPTPNKSGSKIRRPGGN